ncbi:MAG TPA: hypothetical protein VF416_09155 [Marmoricola sp.]
MHKLINSRFALIAVVVVALFAIGTTGATAAHLIKSKDIKDNSIKSKDIKDGTIQTSDLNAATIAGLKQQAAGAPVQTPLGAQLAANSTSDPTAIADIGGSFGKFTATVRATKLDQVTLPAGTYQLTADGFFHSTEATSGKTRLQLALRVDDGSDWGKDFGTCFTGAASALADREVSCSSTRVVTVDAPTTVQVFAFGYADDQGSADSGKFVAQSFLSAIAVG